MLVLTELEGCFLCILLDSERGLYLGEGRSGRKEGSSVTIIIPFGGEEPPGRGLNLPASSVSEREKTAHRDSYKTAPNLQLAFSTLR